MSDKIKSDKLSAIIGVLEQERDKEYNRLKLIKSSIDKKVASVNKMIAYRNEYNNLSQKSLTNQVPALLKNKSNFLDKINQAITAEKDKIDTFETDKIACIDVIHGLEAKIKAIKIKVDDIALQAKIKNENAKMLEMEDMVTLRQGGNDLE